MKNFTLILILIVAMADQSAATTWAPAEHECPVCKTKGTYQEIMSWGSYIYHWPSKFQYVFWPLTDDPSVYCCLNCYYATYMWDFDDLPKGKTDTLKYFLQTIEIKEKYNDYIDIPMTTRLEIAEKVYQILGRDNEFWCRFYRVMGYHYGKKDTANAMAARTKALNIARSLLNESTCKGQEKEIFYIMAAMFYFTEQKDSAIIYLDKAGACKYKNKKLKKENASGTDEYLADLIGQYKAFIRKEEEKE